MNLINFTYYYIDKSLFKFLTKNTKTNNFEIDGKNMKSITKKESYRINIGGLILSRFLYSRMLVQALERHI